MHPERMRRRIRSLTGNPVFYLAAALVVLLLLFSFALVRDSFGIRTRLIAHFTDEEEDGKGGAAGAAGIPTMDREEDEPTRVYFEISDADALDNLIPARYYTRRLTVTYGWGERRSEKHWNLDVSGDCWRLSDPPDEIFCDGERIYSFVSGFASVAEGTDWEPEIGAETLDGIRARLNDPDYAVDVTRSENTVQVCTIEVTHMKDLFEIDIESGLILRETCRYDNDPVRTITTEALAVLEEAPVREEYEERVRDFLSSHPEADG